MYNQFLNFLETYFPFLSSSTTNFNFDLAPIISFSFSLFLFSLFVFFVVRLIRR